MKRIRVVANVVLEPGQVLPSHKTPVYVLFYVHSGSGNVIIGDENIEVVDGDMVPSPNPDISKGNEECRIFVLYGE